MKAFAADKVGLGVDALSWRDVDEESPGPGEVRVLLHAVALNSADLKVVDWRDAASFLHAKVSPYIPGYDLSGIVEDVGDGVTHLAAGDGVFGFLPYAGKTRRGTLADSTVVSAGDLGKKPDAISHVDASCLGTVGMTALIGLRDKLKVQSGHRVLVHGASGGVGTFAVQIAKRMGAVVVATSSAAKMDAVRELGADEVFDYRKTAMHELPGPMNGVFDASSKTSPGACKSIMAPDAAFLALIPSLGFVIGKIASLFSKRSVHFVITSSVPQDLEQLAAWALDGSLKVPADLVFGRDGAAEAFRAFAAGKYTGKVVIKLVEAS